MLSVSQSLYDYVLPVDKIVSRNVENLARLDRLDLRFAFTKIALWRQEQFRKIVYIDADVVALRAPEELFDLQAPFAAAPDIGWPDCFNSGVMALTPNMGEYWSLQTLATSGASFDGADQGLLNEYYVNRPWHRLSFTYNCTPSASYQYEPAYRHFRSGISLVHFIGKDKPWMLGKDVMSDTSASGVYNELLGRWWSVYDRHYKISVR
jgi:glycogenin glucosyltransferase